MMTATLKPSAWTALPNLVFGEALRLTLIAGSLGFVILAGQLAQSRSAEFAPTKQIALTPAVVTTTHHKHATQAERFALAQIQTFEELLDGLTERAEVVLSTTQVAPSDADQLKASLTQLDSDLMAAREALAHKGMPSDRFTDEEIRESILALQEDASRAQGELISLDQPAQGFNVSRTGQ